MEIVFTIGFMNEIVDYIRAEMERAESTKTRAKDKSNPEFSSGYWGGRSAVLTEILDKIVQSGFKLKIDLSLVSIN